MLLRVVWAEEPKNGPRFEIGPSYDIVPMTSQCPSDEQSSCTMRSLICRGCADSVDKCLKLRVNKLNKLRSFPKPVDFLMICLY